MEPVLVTVFIEVLRDWLVIFFLDYLKTPFHVQPRRHENVSLYDPNHGSSNKEHEMSLISVVTERNWKVYLASRFSSVKVVIWKQDELHCWMISVAQQAIRTDADDLNSTVPGSFLGSHSASWDVVRLCSQLNVRDNRYIPLDAK